MMNIISKTLEARLTAFRRVVVIFKFQKEPYFYLFNLGIAAASLGVLLWLGFYAGLIITYPIQAHGNIMFFSFLFSFIVGFLMTAIPRMTQSTAASNYEITAALSLGFAHLIINFNNGSASLPTYSVYIYALQLIFIVFFILKRFLKTKKIPFAGFVFLPFALSLAFFGVIWTLFFSTENFKYFYIFCGEAFILNLICGIGALLIPVICRTPAALNPDQGGEKPKYLEFFIYGLFLNASFLLEFFNYNQSAYGLRVLFLIIYAILKFKILLKPTQRTALGFGLRASILSLILGYTLVALSYTLAGMHVIYISGFTLLTLMVASRVAISHSQRSLNLEINSKPILFTIALIFIAAILRYSITGGELTAVLATAAVAFLIAIWNWKLFILKR